MIEASGASQTTPADEPSGAELPGQGATQAGSEANAFPAIATSQVERPSAGETVEIASQAGVRYVIDFDATTAQVRIEGGDLILAFADGARIVFLDLAALAEAGEAPIFRVGGSDVSSKLIVTQVLAMANSQATLETAAGDSSSQPHGSGANSYSDDFGSLIGTLTALPAIPYVERSFGLIDLEPRGALQPDGDQPLEGQGAGTPIPPALPPLVPPSGSLAPAAGRTAGFFPEDKPTPATLSATLGDLADSDAGLARIVVDFAQAIDLDGSDLATQWQLDPASLTAIAGLPGVVAADLSDGGSTLTIELDATTGSFSADLTLTPPQDSDVDLTGVVVSVTAARPASGQTATGVSSHDLVVDAILDGSDIVATALAQGRTNQFAPIDLHAKLIVGQDSTHSGNSSDPTQSDGADGSALPDPSEYVSRIEVSLVDETSGLPSGSLAFESLPSGVTVAADAGAHTWVFEIDPTVPRADVEGLVDSFGVVPEVDYAGMLQVNIQTTMLELNSPPDIANAASGAEMVTADNLDVDSYSFDVAVSSVFVAKDIAVSGGDSKPFNLVLVIDRSGSMGSLVPGSGGASKFDIAEEAFRTLVDDIRAKGIDVANVRLIGFNTSALEVVDLHGLPNDGELDAFFADLGDPGGETRYEPPLANASTWLKAVNDASPDVDFDNRVFFLSDGGNNSDLGGFLLSTSNGNDSSALLGDLARLYGNVGAIDDSIPNLTIKSVGFGIAKGFQAEAQSNIPGNPGVNPYLALDQSDDNLVNGSALVSNASTGDDLAASFGDVIDPAIGSGSLFDDHAFVGDGELTAFSHAGRIYGTLAAIDTTDADAALAGDVIADDGSSVTIKTEHGGFLTVWFEDQGANVEGDYVYRGPTNYPGELVDSFSYVVQDDIGPQLGRLDVTITGSALPNGGFEAGNLVDWHDLGSIYVEDNGDLTDGNLAGGSYVAVLATNNADGLEPRDWPGNGNRNDEGVVDSMTLEDGNLTPVEDLGKDSGLTMLALYDERDLESFLASHGSSVDLSNLVGEDLLDGAVIGTTFALDPLFGTPGGQQSLTISFDWNFVTDEGPGGENDIAFAVVEDRLFLLGTADGSLDAGPIDVGEDEISYDRSSGWQTTSLSLGADFVDAGNDNTIHVAFGVMDAGTLRGANSALLLDNVQADVS